MRIVQLSDVHLNKENVSSLNDYYLESLISDLLQFHQEKAIDAILITGDLVDKGGLSLGHNPYSIFQEKFILPLVRGLNLSANKILMIPGNHDIDRRMIEEESEFFLSQKLNSDLANKRADAFHSTFNNDNKRIEKFKTFEQTFHKETAGYHFSNNESLIVLESLNEKIGVALINDSWRCSGELKKDQHFFGYKQLYRARNFFIENGTQINIAVFHHPLGAINDNESEEVRNILKSKNFDIAIFGHSHRHEAYSIVSSIGGYLSINGRSAFSDPQEQSSKYQPGYNVIDIDATNRKYKILARKFIRNNGYRFDKDIDALPDGQEIGNLSINTRNFPLADDSNNEDKELPDSYTADVDRIVSLLIGESIYPDKYAFVRELIQNSVDACNRIRQKNSRLVPKITINLDTEENFIEVIDEGDGMTKYIIKNHFSVIGKSISQEYNDNTGNLNLISKFGIGFISTFIVAEKVIVSTKSEEDGRIIFEIENVFKGFKYIHSSNNEADTTTGTSVRVYLKKSYDINTAYNQIMTYCRHIQNLHIIYNSSVINYGESWNVEDTSYRYSDKTFQYEVRLGLGQQPRSFIASNSGFQINSFPWAIIPFRFPNIIGGEINFYPKAIDFDVSRANIIRTIKSDAIRREISPALRILFREALEKNDSKVTPIIVTYLQYYLQFFDGNHTSVANSYKDFYSKKELVTLCSEYTLVDYNQPAQRLSFVMAALKARGLNRIFIQNAATLSDYQLIVVQFLRSMGNLVVKNKNTQVAFHEGHQQTTSLTTVIQIIAAENNFQIQDISAVPPSLLVDMKMDKTQFDERLQVLIKKIENEYSVTIEIGKFSEIGKPSVPNGSQIFLNYSHSTFQSLLHKVGTVAADSLEIYLLGLLGLKLIK